MFDVEKHLSEADKIQLDIIVSKIRLGRVKEGKVASNEYLIVSKDEEYCQQLQDIVEREEFYKSY